MVEGTAHKLLKQQAVCILEEKGFSKKEMFEEYKFGNMIIDCVGIRKGLRIAIECGNLNGNFGDGKISRLKDDFDIVIHLPFLKKGYNSGLSEDDTVIRLPKRTVQELKTLMITPNEPYYHIIGRLIAEHKERV